MIDLGRQRVQIVGNPGQRVIGRHIGGDRAHRGDRVFELTHGGWVVVRTQDQIELGAEIADRVVITGELLGRLEGAQRIVDFAERALEIGQHLTVAAVLAGFVDPARQRADFGLDRIDCLARHRFGNGAADFGEFAAEGGNRLLDIVGTLQRLDLARDLDQVPFQRGEIRTGGQRCWLRHRWRIGRHHRGAWRDRRRAAGRHLPGRRVVQLALARGDFGDRRIERYRAQRRRGTIDLGCGALDHLGLALPFLRRRLARSLIRNLR